MDVQGVAEKSQEKGQYMRGVNVARTLEDIYIRRQLKRCEERERKEGDRPRGMARGEWQGRKM